MRVAFYGRVSTEEQADRGNITGQVEFAERYFQLHGEAENIEGCGKYLDEGVSGTLPLEERPEGSRLLADARAGRISAVYFYRLDRLARSTQVVLNAYNELDRLNVSIKSMTEAFDTGTPVGKFFMTLLASIAALERDTILERTQMGKERKAREGCWTSGPPPFGYRIGPDKKLVVHHPEAETVKMIFRLYCEGMSMVPLADYLNARGIPTPTVSKKSNNFGTGQWQAGHISIILRTVAYTGEYRTMRRSRNRKAGGVIEVPAIVTAEEFSRAGRIMVENAGAARGSRGRRYLLRGIIYCGLCGRAMVGSGSGGRFYYRCTGTVNHGAGRACENSLVRAEAIEQAIWSDIKAFLRSPGSVMSAVKARLDRDREDTGPVERELFQVDASVQEKIAARARVLSLAARSLVTDGEAENELVTLAGEINSLSHRRDTLMSRLEEIRKYENRSAGIEQLLERVSRRIDGLEPPGELIRLLVERVEVGTEGPGPKKVPRVAVNYRFRLVEYEGLSSGAGEK